MATSWLVAALAHGGAWAAEGPPPTPLDGQVQTPSQGLGGAAASWRLSGFYTLGHASVRSDVGVRFARDQTQAQPGPWALDSRLGLQADVPLAPQLDATVQTVLRQRVPGTPLPQSLEWAFLRWAPAPQWQLRLGRTSPDLFLFADVRSVGVAYPWVRPPQEFYAWMPLQSVDGLDVTRSWGDDDATWGLKLSYAQGRLRVAAQAGATPGDAKVQAIRTLTLSRETATSRVKLSYLRARLDLKGAPYLVQLDDLLAGLQRQVQPVLPALAAEAQTLRQGVSVDADTQYLSLGGQRDLGDWSVTAEWSHAWGAASQTDTVRHYLSLGHRFGPVMPFVLTGGSRLRNPPLPLPVTWPAQLAPLVGPAAAGQAGALGVASAYAANLGRMGQRSLGLGVRWDVLPNLAVKAQWDRTRVLPQGRSLWQVRDDARGDAGFTAHTFSVTLDGSF